MKPEQALKQIDELAGSEFDESIAESLGSIIRDVGLTAVKNGQPDIVKACQSHGPIMSISEARLAVANCIKLVAEAVTEDSSQFLTPGEAAKRLKVSENKIREWIKEGKLATINVNGPNTRASHRINPDALNNINETTTPTTPLKRHTKKQNLGKDYFPEK